GGEGGDDDGGGDPAGDTASHEGGDGHVEEQGRTRRIRRATPGGRATPRRRARRRTAPPGRGSSDSAWLGTVPVAPPASSGPSGRPEPVGHRRRSAAGPVPAVPADSVRGGDGHRNAQADALGSFRRRSRPRAKQVLTGASCNARQQRKTPLRAGRFQVSNTAHRRPWPSRKVSSPPGAYWPGSCSAAVVRNGRAVVSRHGPSRSRQ